MASFHHSLFVCCLEVWCEVGGFCLSKAFDLLPGDLEDSFIAEVLVLLLGRVFHLVLQVPSYLLLLLLLVAPVVSDSVGLDGSPPGSRPWDSQAERWVGAVSFPTGHTCILLPVRFPSADSVTYVLFLLLPVFHFCYLLSDSSLSLCHFLVIPCFVQVFVKSSLNQSLCILWFRVQFWDDFFPFCFLSWVHSSLVFVHVCSEHQTVFISPSGLLEHLMSVAPSYFSFLLGFLLLGKGHQLSCFGWV